MQARGVYRITSIARPVDPAFPTNRAVLVAVPLAAALGALLGLSGLSEASPGSLALSAALATFGVWALTRELAPDDDPAAFVGMALAFLAIAVLGPVSVLPVFVALFLTRIVNRSTGLPARWTDSILLTGLVLWAMGAIDDPLIGIAATVAFFLDASLRQPARMQIFFGSVCLGASMLLVVRDGVGMPAMTALDGAPFWLAAALIVAYTFAMFATTRLGSVGDVSGERLDATRVRGGMFVTGLLAAQAPIIAGESMLNPLIWTAMTAVVAGAAVGFVRRSRTGGA